MTNSPTTTHDTTKAVDDGVEQEAGEGGQPPSPSSSPRLAVDDHDHDDDGSNDELVPWRGATADPSDIRSFVISRPVPTCRAPAPTLITHKPLHYWRHFARHHQLGTNPSRSRAAILRALSSRWGPLPGGLQAQTVRNQESVHPHTATVMAFDSMGSLLAVGVNTGSVRVYDYDEYYASVGKMGNKSTTRPNIR